MRLQGGFGSPCSAIYTGFVEIFHEDEWGAICADGLRITDLLAADVVCRQLGFPHGTPVNPASLEDRNTGSDYLDYGYFPADEAEEPQERFWLRDVQCRGPEERLLDCRLGEGFLSNNVGCNESPSRFTVACRSFAVSEALEDVTTPEASATLSRPAGQIKMIAPSCTALDLWQEA